MTTTTDRALAETLLAMGRAPTLQAAPIDPTVAPTYGSGGYVVSNVSRVAVHAALGREGGYRRTVLTVPTFDAASTYTVTVGAVTENEATPATRAALLSALQVALDASLADTYTVTATATTLEIIGPSALVSWTATGGAPVLASLLEYVEGRVRLYSRQDAAAFGSRITDADELITAQAWALHQSCGEPCDFLIGLDNLRLDALPCGTVDALRPWLTDLAGEAGDACSPGAITYRTPLVLVLPCILGAT